MRVDDFTGRKSPGNAAESATPKGKDPPAPLLLMQRGLGAACHSYSNVASGDATHQQNGAYSRADALLLLHRFLKAAPRATGWSPGHHPEVQTAFSMVSSGTSSLMGS